MSNLRTINLMALESLVEFVRGPGFVLDFSDSSFALFFMTELEVDINDPTYADLGGSKGKRLKRFLQKVALVARAAPEADRFCRSQVVRPGSDIARMRFFRLVLDAWTGLIFTICLSVACP